MDFGRPNIKIGQRMANGQLLFLVLAVCILCIYACIIPFHIFSSPFQTCYDKRNHSPTPFLPWQPPPDEPLMPSVFPPVAEWYMLFIIVTLTRDTYFSEVGIRVSSFMIDKTYQFHFIHYYKKNSQHFSNRTRL